MQVGGRADGGIRVCCLAGTGLGVAGDVVEEGMAGGHEAIGGAYGSCGIALYGCDHTAGIDGAHQLHEAIGAGDEVAIGINEHLRDGVHVHVVELDAQQIEGLSLHIRPGGQAVIGTTEQSAGGLGFAIHELILAMEHLGCSVGGVGLVLVDPGGDFVDDFAVRIHIGAGQRHEIGGAASDVQLVIRLKGDVHGALATLIEQVEAVVEELAEQRHPGVERRREAFIGGHVGQIHRGAGEVAQGVEHIDALGGELGAQGGVCSGNRNGISACFGDFERIHRAVDLRQITHAVGGASQHKGSVDGGWVLEALIHHQVGDDARIDIHHIAGLDAAGDVGVVRGVDAVVVVREQGLARDGRCARRAKQHAVVALVTELLRQQGGERLVGGAEVFLSGAQVVVAAVNAAQAPGQGCIWNERG